MWATGPAHRMQESLSLPAFKRKQLRHEPYPSRPPPPLGTSFLPLSRTDTQSVFFVQSQDTFIQRRVQPTSTPTTPAVPFLFLSLSFPHTRLLFAALALPTDLISSPLRGCRRTNTQKKEKKKKNTPMLPWFIGDASCGFFFFFPDFSHACSVKLLIPIQLINHLKSSELTATCLHKQISWRQQSRNSLETLFDCDIRYSVQF